MLPILLTNVSVFRGAANVILGLFEPLFAIASRRGVGLFLKGGIKRRNGIKSALIGDIGNI